MKHLPLIFLLVASIGWSADLPDPDLTPGRAMERRAEAVCVPGYAGSVRNVPTSVKRRVYERYGMKGNDRSTCPEGFEVDHSVPLLLGGSNAIENLWPQEFCSEWGAHQKDRLELRLHKLVCDGELSLREAQECIREDWIKCYQKIFREKEAK